ncbi:unnamed protein product [Owenia fusiformis]|uniref:Uncharacterized protein n=1 Tax=Owenia fusiformis TaxID=6347 RepID=A0A8J1XWU3_OWEFU|nr:unnamed protein product [Owenia fusiformis]
MEQNCDSPLEEQNKPLQRKHTKKYSQKKYKGQSNLYVNSQFSIRIAEIFSKVWMYLVNIFDLSYKKHKEEFPDEQKTKLKHILEQLREEVHNSVKDIEQQSNDQCEDLLIQNETLKSENKKNIGKIQVLGTEVAALNGKIRGYETLAGLYQDCKDDCARLKQLVLKGEEENVRLRQQNADLDSELKRRDASDEILDQRENTAELNDQAEDGGTTAKLIQLEETTDASVTQLHKSVDSSSSLVTGSEQTSDDNNMQSNNMDLNSRNVPTESDEFMEIPSCEMYINHESPCHQMPSRDMYVGISYLEKPEVIDQEDHVPVAELHKRDYILQWQNDCQDDSLNYHTVSGEISNEVKELWNRINKLSLDKEVLSIEVENLTGVLGNITGTGKPTDFAREVSKTTVKILRLEKKCQLLKDIIEHVTEENSSLKAKYSMAMLEKDKQILDGRQEQALLLEKIKVLEHARDNLTPPTNKIDKEDVADWIEVDHIQQTETTSDVNDATKQRLLYLEKKVQKQHKKLKELLDVNQKWDEYNKKREAEYKREIESFKVKEKNSKEADEKRQKQIDQMMLATKKKLDDAKVEMDELSADYESLKLSHKQLGEREKALINQLKGMKERELNMEREIFEIKIKPTMSLYQTNVGGPRHHVEPSAPKMESLSLDITAGDDPNSTIELNPQDLTKQVKDLREENRFLKFQADANREDFEVERRDRERVQGEKSDLKERVEMLEKEWKRAVKKARQEEKQNGEVNAENSRLKRQLKEIQKVAKQSAKQLPVYYVPVSEQAKPSYSTYTKPSKEAAKILPMAERKQIWNCTICTFENPFQRTTCEMCSSPKDIEVSYDSLTGKRSQTSIYPRGSKLGHED